MEKESFDIKDSSEIKDYSGILSPLGLFPEELSRLNPKFSPQQMLKFNSKVFQTALNVEKTGIFYWMGLMQYAAGFISPYLSAMKYFTEMEGKGTETDSFWDTARDFMDLLLFDVEITAKGTLASVTAMNRYHMHDLTQALRAVSSMMLDCKAEEIVGYTDRQFRVMDAVVNAYPRAIRDIEAEYGFHFDNGGYIKIAETERFELYQVLPLDPKVKVREKGKPVLIVPPYVLGANVLAFLPGENRSYVHAFANRGIPTYIRIVKKIETTPAVQIMTGEDDVLDMRFFSERLFEKHGRPLTLNGYCQGGFTSILSLLTGELDGLVDALITCVTPVDGSRSKALVGYMEHIPQRFRDLGYSLKTYPNGNRVVDGKVMSWVFKLKSMEKEAPLLSFYRDLMMFDGDKGSMPQISKTAAAVSHWLTYDRTDIPLAIAKLSFDSYTRPVAKDGTLPWVSSAAL